MEEIIKQIPISDRWECRDFKVKNKNNYPVSSSDSYSLIIPNDKQYTSMSTYIDFEFESSGLIDVNTYILLDLENEFVYSDTIQIQRVNGCGSTDISFVGTITTSNILKIDLSIAMEAYTKCKVRITSVLT